MDEKLHHIQCSIGETGKYVFLCGDPKRVPKIASFLENPVLIADSREFVTYNGFLDGEKVSVCSTGIGGPSAAIAMEELVKAGSHTFMRVGTCGGIDDSLIPGSLIIPTAAIRRDGTASEYMPLAFPAVADFKIVSALKDAAEEISKTSYSLGIVACKDSYYAQHEPERMPVYPSLKDEWRAWKMGGALGSEMESSTLFVVASVLHVRCGTILLLCRNREREKLLNIEKHSVTDMENTISVAINAMRRLIADDKKGGSFYGN